MRKMVWAIIVAYMVGLHNMYKQEQKTPDDTVIKIEADTQQEDDVLKD
ncbi:hypothetical protein [Catalinimonas niigatensis]|nr:hypothetical protein [Catalinimonas niigatensis]WPP49325.1 hypothetical protein PZB72_21895 [Catalinimonas niigatensis]